MKKSFFCVLLVIVMLAGLLPAEALAEVATTQADNIASGTDWMLDAGGKLTISSDAGMQDWKDKRTTYKDSVISIEIQNGVTSIQNSAFDSCQNLTGITISESVTSIGNWAFDTCSKLTNITIPDSVTSIGKRAFAECSGLTSITIPEKVTSIGEYAFVNCSGLTSITIPESVTNIGEYAFWKCRALASITIPENTKVTTIKSSTFSGCSSLTSITIPKSVTSVGNNAFENCQKLTSITIPNNVESIEDGAFYRCAALSNITVPEKVTIIGNNTFYGCSSLTSITIPKSVTEIKSGAFSGCSGLTTVTMLPETPPTVADGVFSDCKFFKEKTTGIHVPEGTEQAYKTAWTAWTDYITDGTQKSDHNHPVCGAECGHAPVHETVMWKPLTQDSFTGNNGEPKVGSGVTLSSEQYKLAAGHYYLDESVSLDKKIYINSGTVNLCLNGQTLTSEIVANSGTLNAIEVSYNATLNLCDCADTGKITSNAHYTLEIKEDANSYANLYGGTVSSHTGICVETRGNLILDGATLKADAGYVIDAQAASTVTIKSGTIEGSGQNCVQMSSDNATLTMTGGTVAHTGGGNAALYFGKSGGTVSGGTITSANGVGIYLSGNSLTLSGAPIITGNKADIIIHANSTITVGDGLIGSYTVFRNNWNTSSAPNNQYAITEAKPYPFTTAASADHSDHFIAAAQMTGIAVRNSGTGGSQQVQLYMPHNWSSRWEQNETHHWHKCHNSAEGNCAIADYADCDEEGAAYGPHQWGYETNPYQHRQKCILCSYAENGWTPHTWDGSHDLDCNVCGYERTVPIYGTVTITGNAKCGQPLTAIYSGNAGEGSSTYQWYRGDEPIPDATESTYTLTKDDIGQTIKVVVTGTGSYTGTVESEVTATEHSYGGPAWTWAEDGSSCTAKFTCSNCSDEQTVTTTVTSKQTKAPTCTAMGETTYTAKADFGGQSYTTSKVIEDIEATGHSYGGPAWTWAEDGSSCTAKFTCSNCSDEQTVTASITSEQTKAPTCTAKGETTYTAKADFGGQSYTTSKVIEDIEATGHSYDGLAWTWAEDGSSCTAKFTCSNCSDEQTVTTTVTSKQTKAPTCTEKGETTYTAKADFGGQSYTTTKVIEDIEAKGHAWSEDYLAANSDADRHYRICSVCNVRDEGAAHKWNAEAATEKNDKHCEICRYVAEEQLIAPGSGTVTQEIKSGENAPKTDISTPTTDLQDMLLTDEEKQQVQSGTDIKIILEVNDAESTVSDADKNSVQQELNDFAVGQYLNIDLYKLVGEQRTNITKTSSKIKIVITVPDSLKNADSSKTRAFSVIRVHDGKAEVLPDMDSNADTITIETDRFSTYAVVYKDTAKEPGGETPHTHSYGDWKSDAANHWKECSCGDKAEVSAHNFGDWTVTKEATETQTGEKESSCFVCGYKKTAAIPAIGGGETPHTHSYGDWKSDAANHWRECSCGDKTEVGAHSFEWVIDKAATATEKGSKHEECTVCGFKKAAVEIPITGATSPQTGDNSNLALWFALLLLSGFGAITTTVVSRKKKFNR